MSRKTTYRFFVMHRLPQIQILDEQLIVEDERLRAEVYYTETLVGFFKIYLEDEGELDLTRIFNFFPE